MANTKFWQVAAGWIKFTKDGTKYVFVVPNRGEQLLYVDKDGKAWDITNISIYPNNKKDGEKHPDVILKANLSLREDTVIGGDDPTPPPGKDDIPF